MIDLVSEYNSYTPHKERIQSVIETLNLVPEVREMWQRQEKKGVKLFYMASGEVDPEEGLAEDENGDFVSSLVHDTENNLVRLQSGFPDTVLVGQIVRWLRQELMTERLDSVSIYDQDQIDFNGSIVLTRLLDGDALAFQNYVAMELNFKHQLCLFVPINIGVSDGHLRSFTKDSDRRDDIMQRTFHAFQKSPIPQVYEEDIIVDYAEYVMDLYQERSAAVSKEDYMPNYRYNKKLAHAFEHSVHRIISPGENCTYYKATTLGELSAKLLSFAGPDVEKTQLRGKDLCKLKFGEI